MYVHSCLHETGWMISGHSFYIFSYLAGSHIPPTTILVKKKLWKLEKEYRDCIKRKWRQDWCSVLTASG